MQVSSCTRSESVQKTSIQSVRSEYLMSVLHVAPAGCCLEKHPPPTQAECSQGQFGKKTPEALANG